MQLNDAHPRLGAYSDGGVAGTGAAGSSAAIIRVGDTDVTLNVRLLPTRRRLSSGRMKWVGLLLILEVLRRIKATVLVRLGNIQVAKTYNDGQWACGRNLLRRNDRDLALMRWNLMVARMRDGLGRIEAKHQKGHAERRKQRTEFDIHEIYNDKVGRATRTVCNGAMAYVSFAPLSADRTGGWYEPLETENVGAGTAYEVTSNAYRHITLASQRRTANEHAMEKDGLFLTTFSQGALGRSAKEGTAVRTTKMMRGHLPTAARLAMWGGDKDGSITCAYGAALEWNDGKVAHLQNHILRSSMVEPTRWPTQRRPAGASTTWRHRHGLRGRTARVDADWHDAPWRHVTNRGHYGIRRERPPGRLGGRRAWWRRTARTRPPARSERRGPLRQGPGRGGMRSRKSGGLTSAPTQGSLHGRHL